MITYKINTLTDFEQRHKDYFNTLLGFLIERNLLSPNIDEIILTDEYDAILKFLSQDKSPTREREYMAVGSIVSHSGKKKVVFNANYVHNMSELTVFTFCGLLIQVFAEDLIEAKFKFPIQFSEETPFSEVLKSFFSQWATKIITGIFEKDFFVKQPKIHQDVKIYVDSFKKKVRKLHYQYQKDQMLGKFWIDIIQSVDSFIRRCIDVANENGDFTNLQEFKDIIPPLLKEIESQAKNLLQDKEVDITVMKKYLLLILKRCYIDVPKEAPLEVRIEENPKKIFRGTLVDTEPRLVAFIDILGFSEIIKEHDTDGYSNILNELHDTLEEAIKVSIDRMTESGAKTEIKEFLEYRMFSDCLCISLPYIEYGNDFHIQFHSLGAIVRNYQLAMMQKGFYVRGGLSMGSFYADKNMIFSGGLINAYKLEQTVKYPIIVIDDNVLDRLKQDFAINAKGLFYERTMIYSITEPKKVFFNPFDSLDSGLRYLDVMKTALADTTKLGDDEDDELGKLTNALLNTMNNMLQPILDMSKDYLKPEVVSETKKKILELINEQIWKFEKLLSTSSKTQEVLDKYHFLKSLTEWSINDQELKQFQFYEFDVRT